MVSQKSLAFEVVGSQTESTLNWIDARTAAACCNRLIVFERRAKVISRSRLVSFLARFNLVD